MVLGVALYKMYREAKEESHPATTIRHTSTSLWTSLHEMKKCVELDNILQVHPDPV